MPRRGWVETCDVSASTGVARWHEGGVEEVGFEGGVVDLEGLEVMPNLLMRGNEDVF